ncbi:1-deoxy-D-xylulose 5-phosphate synthase [uncultured Candidatus Thioglobus sp.]|nr:1-deoxy-D-xylulose 5-phosphate synthase [uncultured Candidatus Thioglobus sp.]
MTINTPFLDTIKKPADLRKLPISDLEKIADELREFILYSVSNSGGHLAASLGAIELTVALHYLYNTPQDQLVWDVGHQAYAHKILTGRKDQMHTLRKWGGIAPFPKRTESIYDSFSVGHASTSISAALGMSIAMKHKKCTDHKAVAIIGDGGMTAGMAFEALNHAGDMEDTDLLVVLNDNCMSISPNVGALSNLVAKTLASNLYSKVKEKGKEFLANIPNARDIVHYVEGYMKGVLPVGILIEAFGFNYTGPIDGHDLSALIPALRNIRQLKGKQFLHVITKKGKGYAFAETEPIKYHGVSTFDPEQGVVTKQPTVPSYSQIFGDFMLDISALDERVVAITPAMSEGSGLVKYAKKFPNRYFDVGIAEQHSVTFAAGLACGGLKPIVAIYSTFLQRAYDQLIHDVVIQNLPVLFAIDRAGCVGGDGPTHNGCYDISFMRCLTNIVIMIPADENECRQMLYTGIQLDCPSAVRYPKDSGIGCELKKEFFSLAIGKAEIKTHGERIAILAFGVVLQFAQEAAKEFGATVVNMRFVKPIDEDLILAMAKDHDLIVTVEENVVQGGAGEAVHQVLANNRVSQKIAHYGLPDRLIQHGTRQDMLDDAGMHKVGLINFINYHLHAG